MYKFKYYTFVCDEDQLQAALTELGSEGWRLHTCEPVVTTGPAGSGVIQIFCVLDQQYDEERPVEVVEASGSEGMAMKG